MHSIDSSGNHSSGRQRILFFAEAVTLAHVARPMALAQALDPARYEVYLACDPRYLKLFGELPFEVHPIRSISSECFLDALARGRPLYDVATLRSYIKEDLGVIKAVSPDAIVGDFRLSLSVSARVAGEPYLAITNAHWSPYARQRFLVPELALTQRLGSGMGQIVFSLMRPLIFAHHSLPFNRVKREYGLPYAGFSLPQIFTDADGTLYPDLPELVPTFYRPCSHDYLGPILWSPARIPSWWNDLPRDKEAIYVSLGTSGRIDLLPVVLDAVTDLGLPALVATAGRADIRPVPGRLWVADYLPGVETAKRVDLFICNGGSATVYQALAAGVPVIGIPTNLDQYLTMFYVRRAGVGELVRAGEASAAAIKKAITHALRTPSFRQRSESLKAPIEAYRPEVQLSNFLTKAMRSSVTYSRAHHAR